MVGQLSRDPLVPRGEGDVMRAVVVTAYTEDPEVPVSERKGYLGRATMDMVRFAGTYNQAVANCVSGLIGHYGDKMKSFHVSEVN